MIAFVRPFIASRKSWQNLLICMIAGLLSVLALPPFGIWPFAFIALIVFFLVFDQAETKKSAFLRGWAYGIGFFGGGLYWLTNAFLVNSDQHAWMIPIAIPLLAAFVGLFIGLTSLVSYMLGRFGASDSKVIGRILIFASVWMLLEWVRSWIFTGFPWNMMGTIWGASDVMLQNAALFGAFGLSFVTVFIATLGAAIFYLPVAKRVVVGGCVCLIVVFMYEYGAWRLSGVKVEHVEGVNLRIVQPNIAQNEKWLAEKRISNFNILYDLSIATDLPPDQRPSHILWPETAVTFPVNRDINVRRAIAEVVPNGGSLITGSPLMSESGVEPFQIWNSLVVVDESAEIIGRYDKSHLVPFGEYVPLRDIFSFAKLTAGRVDFSKGNGLETLKIEGLPSFSPLICYEVIFPNQVIVQRNRPKWLLNLTNDGWYGDTPGPYQHAMSARMRSIEEGLPVVRVANTGISFITDSYGRIQAQIPYGIKGFLDVPLPKEIEEKPLGAQIGNGIIVAFLFLTFVTVFLIFRKPNDVINL